MGSSGRGLSPIGSRLATLTPSVPSGLVGNMLGRSSRDTIGIDPCLSSNGSPLITHILGVTLNLNVITQALNKPLVGIVRRFTPPELGVLSVIMLDIINKQMLGLPQILNKLFTENVLSIGIVFLQQTMLATPFEDPDPLVPKSLYAVVSIIL